MSPRVFLREVNPHLRVGGDISVKLAGVDIDARIAPVAQVGQRVKNNNLYVGRGYKGYVVRDFPIGGDQRDLAVGIGQLRDFNVEHILVDDVLDVGSVYLHSRQLIAIGYPYRHHGSTLVRFLVFARKHGDIGKQGRFDGQSWELHAFPVCHV